MKGTEDNEVGVGSGSVVKCASSDLDARFKPDVILCRVNTEYNDVKFADLKVLACMYIGGM